MNTKFLLVGLVSFLLACNKPIYDSGKNISITTLNGNWYTDFQNGEGIWEDSLTTYGEIYLTDSLHRSILETFGLTPSSFYHVRDDSILLCYYSDYFDCEEPVGHKILSVNKDTIWLIQPK